jgi:L-serine dehydratase
MGPVMIGPSSSHTAGAVKIGLAARTLLESNPKSGHITFYGSFAKTYKGHGTDKAVVAGILGLSPDDSRIRNVFKVAAEKKFEFTFSKNLQENSCHPNTAKIELTGENGEKSEVVGASVGGGNILINEINGRKVHFSGEHDTLIVVHNDFPGIIAEVTNFLASYSLNICSFQLSRSGRGGTAVMTIETDNEIPESICDDITAEKNILKCMLTKKIKGV